MGVVRHYDMRVLFDLIVELGFFKYKYPSPVLESLSFGFACPLSVLWWGEARVREGRRVRLPWEAR
jgi:hypothetical protein